MVAKKVELTKDGITKLNDEMRNLIDVVRPEVIEQLKAARAQGDLSENADYDAARSRQAEVEGRIKQIEDILANAVLINDEKNRKTVGLGSLVSFVNLSTDKEYNDYRIVGTVEADPFKKNISNACPLGQALIGKAVNGEAVVKAKIPYTIKVTKISI